MNDYIGQSRNDREAVVRGIRHERVQNLISSGAKLVIGIIPVASISDGNLLVIILP